MQTVPCIQLVVPGVSYAALQLVQEQLDTTTWCQDWAVLGEGPVVALVITTREADFTKLWLVQREVLSFFGGHPELFESPPPPPCLSCGNKMCKDVVANG